MASAPVQFAFAKSMAKRSEPTPESFALVTISGLVTATLGEYSEVTTQLGLPQVSIVASAETLFAWNPGTVTFQVAKPLASSVGLTAPIHFSPSVFADAPLL